ncbi:hypothetical protein BC332_32031 [Capsicum chinense]|nr:hypothetical protein BC332_32031 [Capsicum chinense]
MKGKVPPSLINCTHSEILDLGNNDLNDTFPSWLGGLPLSRPEPGPSRDKHFEPLRPETLLSVCKGTDLELPQVLTSHMFIDLSRNRFEGYLPTIIGDLIGLRVLNLFHNGLEGIIPESLHQLSVLESLDLSSNKIGSEIPQQLASLTFLAVLNLSHNHLVGCIPKGKQFNMFESSSYQGNDGLRGLPLSKDCGGNDGVPQASTPVELDDEEEEGDLIS